uniref:Uncharacterized protein n=1 Tax=Setaria viridis TaxID=4556 RepID=A0A4V6DC07_SETVI|nr:hypothetical protein SEVIR_2G351950v2 [Setaria viridis]
MQEKQDGWRWNHGISEVRSIRLRFKRKTLFFSPSTSCSKCISAYTITGCTAAEKQRNLKQEERQEAAKQGTWIYYRCSFFSTME